MSTTAPTTTCTCMLPAVPAVEHPARCSGHWCRVTPRISPDGHVTGWVGWHRSEAEVTMVDDCILAEVSVGQREDAPLPSPLAVHLLLRNTQNADEAFEAGLTPAEARALGRLLISTADFADLSTR